MSQIYQCPQGHRWENDSVGVTLPLDQAMACPVCGAPMDSQAAVGADVPGTSEPPTNSRVNLLEESGGNDPDLMRTVPPVALRSSLGTTPATVAGYEILCELGRGGMGVVYKARQVALNRLVALKMVLAGAHASPEVLARFRSEAEAVARLQHPNIVQIYEVNEQDGLPYFSMEFVDGISLAEQANDMPQPARWAAEMVEKLARAMHAAHQRGIVHRDLKPGNVLLTADGQPRITDFGLAKQLDTGVHQTRTGDVMGTPCYMAPEQAEGRPKDIGPHTDVYALGAILYELLTGRPPFRGETDVDTMVQVLCEEPVPPHRFQARLPLDLETICLKCLQKAPARRYPSAEALADDLHRHLNQEPIVARPITLAERVVKWARRRPAVAALLVFSSLLTLGLFGFSLYANVKLNAAAKRERQKAVEAQTQRQLAEDNLQQAREAVDQMLTVVGRDLLEDVPGFDQKRTALLSKAVEFYQGFLQQKSQDPKMRRELGQTYFTLGTLYYRGLRQYDNAEKAYAHAIDQQTSLMREFPDDSRYRQDVANSYNFLGETLRTRGLRLSGAETAYDAALELQEQLARDSTKPAYRQELARTHYNRGILRMDTGRRPEAMEDFQAAIGLLSTLKQQFPSDPDYRHGLARGYINRGILLKDTDQADDAEKDYGEAIRLLTELHQEYLARSEYRHELAVSHINRGNLRTRHDRSGEAEADFRTALPLLQRLREDFPERPGYRYELANCLNSLVNVLWASRDFAEARKMCEQALPLQRQLVADFNGVPDYHSALAGSLDNLAMLLGNQKPPQLEKARQLLSEARPHHQEAIKANPKHRTYCQRLRDHFTLLAEVLLGQKEHAAASQVISELVQVFPDDWRRYQRAAELLARCMVQADGVVAEGYADGAVEMLKKAIERGLLDTRLLTTPALKTLRERRKDCDRMLRELEQKTKS
jgi:serine/threonine-protein kinase